MTSVKWLSRIEVLRRPFTGYQNARGYRYRTDEDDAGEPLSRIAPRALLIPPGIPEFMTRTRTVDAGEVVVRGRAWSGLGHVERVDVSDDGGTTWGEASLDEPSPDPFAWRGWVWRWTATVGEHVLSCRAADATGRMQPLEPTWNVGGYVNNAVQRVPVVVR
jgi:hypothetical protein